ncbi:hypothetical protein L6452_25681 [Arctium lappa]|uniref:Uncharacterized protein n=1 Tax=Arctium lappa TaxID=4217 RepID=A0ACB9ACP0_ARCLA|nr:hypothetical protein L6452_25681 [Arctium lappa]
MASQTTLIKSKNVKFEITASQLTPTNYLTLVEFPKKKPSPHLQYAVDFLKASPLAYAFFVAPPPSKVLLQQFWFTTKKSHILSKQGNPITTKEGFEALPTDEGLIRFLDLMEYEWDLKTRTTVPYKRLTKSFKAKMSSELNYVFSHIIQCMSGKMGLLDQSNKVQLQMGFSVIAGRNIDFVALIFDDLMSKVEKTEREIKIPYVRFISGLLKFVL